eukprot:comp39486_c0_seq1/m.47383 comp39486_c0_seq1/g.47383  ORF comp39486_c0_seq1/g.47383 comp39486_c0_seq1/m.47383 type:complete len:472 (-) comp39486_c0_seq1:3-1418(-)
MFLPSSTLRPLACRCIHAATHRTTLSPLFPRLLRTHTKTSNGLVALSATHQAHAHTDKGTNTHPPLLLLVGAFFVGGVFSQRKHVGCEGDEAKEEQTARGEGLSRKHTGLSAKLGFRDSKVAAYEDRIRRFSNPDKIFRYFASRECDGIIYMKAEDFVRSLVPSSLQPEGLGLDLYKKIAPGRVESSRLEKVQQFEEDSGALFFQGRIYISYAEYIFFRMILSTPVRNFEVAFRMLDQDGNGTLDRDEFLSAVMVAQTGSSMSSRPHQLARDLHRSQLMFALFGRDPESRIDLQRYTKFVKQLKKEIRRLEYQGLAGGVEGRLSEKHFVTWVTRNASGKVKERMMEKIEELPEDEYVAWTDWYKFHELLDSLDEVADALALYSTVGSCVDRATFGRAFRAVSGEELSPQMVDLAFKMFDFNGDGCISHREFTKVMKLHQRNSKPKGGELGLLRGMASMYHCMAERVNYILD